MTSFPVTGVDVSRWQKSIDWQKALHQGISFAFVKASQGGNIIDSQFERNMQETARLAIPRGIYHFFKPEVDWKKQADLFIGQIRSWDFELDAVVDIERDGGLSKTALNSMLEKFTKHVESRTGRRLMIYTSPGFWDSAMPLTNWAYERRLWIAHWTRNPAPTIPQEWHRHGVQWTFWQWSAKNQEGQNHGAATKSIDLDRFYGSMAYFRALYNLPTPPDPAPTPQPGTAAAFEVLPPSLHIFTAPDVNSRIVGELEKGDVVSVCDVSGTDEVWIEIEPDAWVLLAYNGRQLLSRISP
jgi:lysozyme